VRTACRIVILLGAAEAGCSLVAGLGNAKVLDDAGVDSQAPPVEVPDGAEGGMDATLDGDASGSALGDGDAQEGAIGEGGGLDVDASACDSFDGGSPFAKAVSLSVGSTHACAVINVAPGSPENGTVRCWGSNRHGELGRDPCLPFSWRPHTVLDRAPRTELIDVDTLALSDGYSCAITGQGRFLSCWGKVPDFGAALARESDLPAYLPSLMDYGSNRLQQIVTASVGIAGRLRHPFRPVALVLGRVRVGEHDRQWRR